ncbi:MAG: ATP-binding cassette domain-containing protein [Desulfurococcaceae archaeon]
MKALEARISRCGYPGGFEIRGISVDLEPGEVLLVAGRSGSGKTTLVRGLTGTIKAAGGYFEGYVKVHGKRLDEMSPNEVSSLVAYVPQEPWYGVLAHTAYADVCHMLSLRGLECSRSHLEPFGVASYANKPVYNLSAGQVQRVLWTSALAGGAKLLVLDEPLVYLDEEGRRSAREAVEKLAREGAAVVVVDHNPLFWEGLEPRLLYMEQGVAKYYGRWSRGVVEVPEDAPPKRRIGRGVYAELRDVWFKYPGERSHVLRGFSFRAEKGVLTALVGPNGSGKTTILKLASGLLKPQRGLVARRGPSVYVPENPLLYFTMPTPREELLLSARGDESRALEAAEVFGVKHVLDKPLARVSTGERRRIALASAWLAGFEGYFVDEPTGGLDDYSARSVLEALSLLAEWGRAVVVASHDKRVIKAADVVVEVK